MFNAWLLLATVLGISLIIASGCVINNYVDRDIDQLMDRTKNRLTARGLVSRKFIAAYSLTLGLLGGFILYFFTNTLTLVIAFIGFIFYVVIYTLWLKRTSIYGTLVGGVSGAVPPVVGYCAVTGQFDMGAFLLFLILFTWQIPHSYAIAIYRLDDYARANIPVLPVVKGIPYTKASMLIYLVAFTLAVISPVLFGYVGLLYLAVASALSLSWLYIGIQGVKTTDDKAWARKMFLWSIINITILCAMMWVKI